MGQTQLHAQGGRGQDPRPFSLPVAPSPGSDARDTSPGSAGDTSRPTYSATRRLTPAPGDGSGALEERRVEPGRPCDICEKPIPPTGQRGRPRRRHASCETTARYQECLARGGHTPSGRQALYRPGHPLPLEICERCEVPFPRGPKAQANATLRGTRRRKG